MARSERWTPGHTPRVCQQLGDGVLRHADRKRHLPRSLARDLEWVRAKENVLLIGPPGTGKSHALLGCGVRAVERGLRVRYLGSR